METENSSSVPPGFRFHPTEEELVGYYLNRKINSLNIDLDVIVEVDLYRIEPWDIQDKCKYGYEGQNEWYFFSYKDKKYPTGTRTNRATSAGFWKATGRDKAVLSCNRMIGMRKTLVFYKGRAPNGQKTDWIMHEYRLQTSHQAPPQEEGWVVCRAFKKQAPNQNQRLEGWSSQAHYPMIRDHNYSYKPLSYSEIPSTSNTMDMVSPNQAMLLPHSPFNSEQDHFNPNYSYTPNSFIESPQQDSSSLLTYDGTEYMQNNSINQDQLYENESRNFENSCVDWKNLDELLTEPPSFLQSSYDRDAQNHPSHLFSYLPDL